MEKPNMQQNFNLLNKRVIDTLTKTDLSTIRECLSRIKEPTICTGVGGSSAVSIFTSKVLSTKNQCIVEHFEPRDIKHKPLHGYRNILACSYSGANIGVTESFNNMLTKYLLSTGTIPNINNLTYISSLPKEDSFISLASTLMPMSIMLSYYLDNNIQTIKDILFKIPEVSIPISNHYEIFTGYETNTASSFLESTLVESGIAIPTIHDKYSYCHGRSTTSYHNNTSTIYLDSNTELDELLKSLLSKEDMTLITSPYTDPIISDYYQTYYSMYLAKYIAEQKGKDLSRVEYSPLVKKLYHYKGEL